MDAHPARHLDVRGHQQRGPDHGVELEDVLADHVQVGRPEAVGEVLALTRVGERRVVVEEGVDPDVDDLRLVPRHRHAPLEPRPAERDVLEAALDERERLVEAHLRDHEVRAFRVEPLERLLERRQPEEPVVLHLPLERDLVDRAAVAVLDLRLRLEVRAARAEPALVGALVDVAVVVDPLHDLGDPLEVLGVGGADEEVVRGVHGGRQLLEAHRVAVAQLARGDPLALGRQRDRLAVLVGAREEEHVLAPLAHVAGEHVGRDRRVGVPEMGLAVHVVDRRGDVVGHEDRCYWRVTSARDPRERLAAGQRERGARPVRRTRRASRGPGRRARERERPLGPGRRRPRGRRGTAPSRAGPWRAGSIPGWRSRGPVRAGRAAAGRCGRATATGSGADTASRRGQRERRRPPRGRRRGSAEPRRVRPGHRHRGRSGRRPDGHGRRHRDRLRRTRRRDGGRREQRQRIEVVVARARAAHAEVEVRALHRADARGADAADAPGRPPTCWPRRTAREPRCRYERSKTPVRAPDADGRPGRARRAREADEPRRGGDHGSARRCRRCRCRGAGRPRTGRRRCGTP